MSVKTETIRIGTRGSVLALAQAEETKRLLMAAHALPDAAVILEVMSTRGDRVLDRPLAEIGGKGLFTEEIEAALLAGTIDIAVHSSKDMPTLLPDGLYLSAFLAREDPRDAFVSRKHGSLDALPIGATFGTSSLRRAALLRRTRPDLEIVGFRGNVQTRMRKLEDGVADATVLANAGLRRLGLEHEITELLDLDRFPPAPGQGAICVESRIGDTRTDALLAALDDQATRQQLDCERAFLGLLDGSCRTPIAGHAVIDGGDIRFSGLVLTPDGTIWHDIVETGARTDASLIGKRAAARIRDKAGALFFDSWV